MNWRSHDYMDYNSTAQLRGDAPGLRKAVLPPIHDREGILRHRYLGTSNPSYLHNEETPQNAVRANTSNSQNGETPQNAVRTSYLHSGETPQNAVRANDSNSQNGETPQYAARTSILQNAGTPQYAPRATPMRRELPKTPEPRRASRLEVPHPKYTRERRSHSAHVPRHLQERGRPEGARSNKDLEMLPDMAFVNLTRHGGARSPAGFSVESGSRSPKLDSRSSGSRSAEPDSPLIKETKDAGHESNKDRYDNRKAENHVRYRPQTRESRARESRATGAATKSAISASDVRVERVSPSDDVFYSHSPPPPPLRPHQQKPARTPEKTPREVHYKDTVLPAVTLVGEKPFNLVPQRRGVDLHIVFDIFTHNPLDVPLSPNLAGNSGDTHAQTIHPYWSLVRTHQQNKQFIEGMMLRSVTQEAYFPYIHYIVYRNDVDMKGYRRRGGTSPPPPPSPPTPPEREENSYHPANSSDCSISSGDNIEMIGIINSQGGYREMQSFVDRDAPVPELPKRPQNETTAYLITAFKTLANQDTRSLDAAWTTWSGADFIVEHVPAVLQLVRVTFHKVRYDSGADTFHYILMCELANAVPKMSRALCFIESLKMRQCGYSNLYLVDHSF